MKKITRITWHGINVFLPLSETSRMVRAARYIATRNATQLRRLLPTRNKEVSSPLSFIEAVRASGLTREQLIQRYWREKRVWLLICILTALLALVLPVGWWMSDVPPSGLLVLRIASLLFMLAGFAGLLFVRALHNQYRLWQLQTNQLGTFAEWKAKERWLRATLSWHPGR
jgi:hypothetical protein